MIQLNIDTASLLDFSINRPVPSDDDRSQDNDNSVWKDLFWFIKDENIRINLQINNQQDIEQNTSSPEYALIRFLLDKYLSSNGNINLSNNVNHIEINKPPFCKLNISSDNAICSSKTYCINRDNLILSNWEWIRKIKSRNVASKFRSDFMLTSWKDLNELVIPCNSLIVCDNYLFRYYRAQFDNFIKLISSFLPANKKIEFQLIIITSLLYKNIDTGVEEKVDVVYDSIRNLLDRKGYGKSKITLVKATVEDTHDRHIFSNYQIIKSGHSFNYFDSEENVNLRQPTTVDIFPLIAETDVKNQFFIEQYKEFLEHYRRIVSEAKDSDCIGSRECRLFNI